MDQNQKPRTIKQWKVLETMYMDKRPVRRNVEMTMTVEKECPVFAGDRGDYDGDPRVTARITWSGRTGKLHMSWTEACQFAEMVQAARPTCDPLAQVVEDECQKRRDERAHKRAERENYQAEDLKGGFGEAPGKHFARRTGKTERDREKRRQRVQGQSQE